ncbi:MAG: helix-turn-helix domain-containing protein [Clostridia bacterium]|nr:helix-turn-helix domain-containing protein [Clostridia bacterium]
MENYKHLDRLQAGMRIWELINSSEMTVEKVSEFLCLSSPRVIYDWMSGKKTPTLERAYNLASLFNTTIGDIFFK